MKNDWAVLSRRTLLAGMAGAGLIGLSGRAYALSGFAALDTPAIAVKNPAAALLTAITLTPGGRLVAVGEHGVVITSDDNGASWAQASVPVNLTLTCVAFATAQTGWAAGHFGLILNTQDGGKTWQKQLDGIQANQLTLAAANDPSVATNPAPGAPHALHRAQHFQQSGPANPFLTLLVFSPQELIVFGAYRMAMKSVDGGKSWVDWDLHIYDEFSHNIYDAATIGDVSYLVSEQGLTFASTDGGNSFLPLGASVSSTLLGVLGAKDGSVIVFGVAGAAARSTDQGKSWTPLSIATQQDLAGGRLLASGAIILVDEGGMVFESTDNGATFNRVQGIQTPPLFDVQQAPDGGLVAVGAAGVSQIAKSLLA